MTTTARLDVLARHVSPGELEDVARTLPASLRPLIRG